jgi:HAD superfamily hydrolase (TIGR01459 family)
MTNISQPNAIPILTQAREMMSRYQVILCDIWGVVHNGRAHFPEACAALAAFREQGGSVILVTNAPRPHPPIRQQLKMLGVPDASFDDIVTSGDVTLHYIASRVDAPLYHIGPERDLTLFDILAENTGIRPPLVSLDKASYVVCTGLFHDDRETPDDYAAALAEMKARKLDFICANPDLVVHVGDRLIYCAGALAQSYEDMGGRVLQAGKPYAPIYERALELARHTRQLATVDKREVLAIGDAMRTDIRGACDFGVDALFVTSGIHRDDVHKNDQLDKEAFDQFISSAESVPTAAMAHLRW